MASSVGLVAGLQVGSLCRKNLSVLSAGDHECLPFLHLHCQGWFCVKWHFAGHSFLSSSCPVHTGHVHAMPLYRCPQLAIAVAFLCLWSLPCKYRVPRVATDCASLALFLLEDAALKVNLALGKIPGFLASGCLVCPPLRRGALRVDAFGVVPRFGVGVLVGSHICAVFSSVNFFIVSGVLEVLFDDYLLQGGYGINFCLCLLLVAASMMLLVSVLQYLQSQMNLVVATIHLITCSL